MKFQGCNKYKINKTKTKKNHQAHVQKNQLQECEDSSSPFLLHLVTSSSLSSHLIFSLAVHLEKYILKCLMNPYHSSFPTILSRFPNQIILSQPLFSLWLLCKTRHMGRSSIKIIICCVWIEYYIILYHRNPRNYSVLNVY